MENKNKFHIGIDLGTTNSVVSVAEVDKTGRVNPRTLNVEQIDDFGLDVTYDAIVPSALYVDENGVKTIGRYAIKMLDTYPKRVLREVKRHIGVLKEGRVATWNINDETFTPEIVSSYVLKKLKYEAEKHVQSEVDSVVITVPANFNFTQVGATKTAGKLAGFDPDKIHIISEPTAALIYYLNEEREKSKESRRLDISEGNKKKLLVFDLGGGTCDVSIVEAKEDSNGNIDIKELSISQYTELGGVDFDQVVVHKLLLPRLFKEKGITPQQFRTFPVETQILLQSNLKKIAEQAKKEFTRVIKSRVEMDKVDYFEESSKFDNLKFKRMTMGLPPELTYTFVITKAEYDECIKCFLYESESKKDIESPIKNALRFSENGLSLDDIDEVFLVGGMTHYPTIQKRIYEIFNKRMKPITSINPMLSVSNGAAIYNYYKEKISITDNKSGSKKTTTTGNDIVVKKILPDNIYIDVVIGDPIVLLEKGTEAGSSKIIENKFVVDSGNSDDEKISEMEIMLFTAESPKAMKVTELESAQLTFRRPVTSGSKITIKAEFTDDQDVIVSAWLADDESEKIDVKIGASKITPEQEKAVKQDSRLR